MSDVAKTILDQMGGNKFITMTGARNLLKSEKSLSFQLPMNGFNKNRIFAVKITLEPNDTYRMVFMKRNMKTKEVYDFKSYSDIYANNLQILFTDITGLETHL